MPTRVIDLPEHLDALIESGIASGRFPDASAAVREGLHLLGEREDAAKLERLREAARAGFDALDRGECVQLDEDALRRLIGEIGQQASGAAKARRQGA